MSRIYIESLAAEKHSTRYFYSYLPLSQTSSQTACVDRTKFQAQITVGGLKYATFSSLILRYPRRKSCVDLLKDVFDVFDLRSPIKVIII